jgi:hypothetical protein
LFAVYRQTVGGKVGQAACRRSKSERGRERVTRRGEEAKLSSDDEAYALLVKTHVMRFAAADPIPLDVVKM